MIDLVLKFIGWIKDVFSLIISLPGKFLSILTSLGGFLSFLPDGLDTIIIGLIITLVTFSVVYAIVKLVTNLL